MIFLNSSWRSKIVHSLATISIFFLLQVPFVRTEIGLSLPAPKTSLVPIIIYRKPPPVSISTPFNLIPIEYPRSFKHSISIDSTGQTITATKQLKNIDILFPRYLTLNEYISERSRLETQNQWREYAYRHVTSTGDRTQAGKGITIETPKIKSEAFRKVFGGETLSLRVTGDINIEGSMRHEKRSQVKTAINRAPNTNFQMKQTQRFKVEGKIGENVSVFVDQDSERPFEFENAIKLQYSSDEDGIVQSIQAGNVALSLPGTRFVTFSAQNSGLFGIKSQFKVGALDLTAIASMEKGQKNKLTITGGKESSVQKIEDYNYKKGTYFFLDEKFREGYTELDANGTHISSRYVTDIEVYKSDNNYEGKPGVELNQWWAFADLVERDTTSQESYKGYFKRLEPNSDYYIDRRLGFIAMNMQLQESEILAVAYRDSVYRTDETNEYGIIPYKQSDYTGNPFLKLIKIRNQQPYNKTWDLEWKNVYSLGGRNIDKEGFELKIFFKTPSGNPEESIRINGNVKGYLNIFGLDFMSEDGSLNPDNVIDFNDNFLDLGRGELIFPDLQPFYPEGTDSRLPEEKWTRAIYDTTARTYITQQSKFYIEVKSSSRSPNYSLGLNVIEGSEEVVLNGTTLKKDLDYIIDYFSGSLTLLKEEATDPNANLEINYESQQLFSVDKKSLMGARAEYTLWDEGSNRSFIGATLLYLNQKTLDQRIRVGKEAPMKNMVWDVNTALKFEPAFLTKALDALPLISATSPSSVSFEGEIAQVLPNPNTLNSESTGDPDGVAYLDDFEGAKRQISLGVIRSGWGPCSPPTTGDAQAFLKSQGRLIWYNPYQQVAIQEIWPDREVTTNFGGTTRTHVLTMQLIPNQNDTLLKPVDYWGGVQRALSAGYFDQKDSRFLEIWVKGDHGRLHIDLGQISEDVIPNQKRDTEDKKRNGLRNELLDEDEDTGLDGTFGNDPPTLFHSHEESRIETNGRATPYDFWDINGDSIKQTNEPWSYDNWQYTSGVPIYDKVNGTEGNKYDGIAIYPDTEDLNRNGGIDRNNNYFEFTFSLDKTSEDTLYIAGGKGNEYGWRLYRLSLDDYSKVVGNPDWSRIEYARIWIDSVEQATQLSIAEINLVGNEWKLRGTMTAQDSTYNQSDDSTMTVAVMNTHDNPEYTSPPGVEGVIDPIQRIRSKEQSLVIELDALDSGATAIAQKELYQAENLIQYRTLKMFVHGGDITNNIPADGSIEFFLQWGSDPNSLHYYEVSLPVFPGWDHRNDIEIDFEILSRLKIEMDTLDTISELQSNGHTISVYGKPSLTNIRWLIVGIKNNGEHPFTGQVWIDELRLSGVRKDKGVAMRVKADIRLSDFISFNGEFNRKDADFHTVNERIGRGVNEQSGTFNASVQLHKLFPTGWGLSLPVTVNYSRSRSTPKYLPGSDILVNERTAPDSLLQEIRNESTRKGLSVSLSKRTKSRNFWIRYFIDPLRSNFSYSYNNSSSSQVKYSEDIGYKGSFSYDLSFGKQNYLEPFAWLGKNGFFKKIAQTKFYYLPTKLSFKLDGSDNYKDSMTRSGVPSKVITANFSRSFATGIRPFQDLSFDFSRTHNSDMRNSEWTEIFSSLDPGDIISVNQKISTSLGLKIFSWLSPTAKYNVNYQWNDNIQMRTQGTSRSARVNTSITLSGNFDPGKLVQSFSKKSSRSSRRTRRPVSRRRSDKKVGEKETSKEEKKKVFRFLSIFSPILSTTGNLIQKIDPVSVSISENNSAQNNGILGIPTFSYQIGQTLDPGVPSSPKVATPSTSKKDSRISLRSGLKITSQLSAKLDYSSSNSENQTTTITGNITKSALLLKGKAIPFPNWSVQWRGLEKLPLISRLAKSVSLNHSFSGKLTQTWNESPDKITQETISKDFRPLLGLTLSFLNGITANAQFQNSTSIKENKTHGQGKTKQVSSQISITAKYSKRGGFKIPFFKGKKLDNNIDISLTYTSSLNGTSQSTGDEGKFQETSKTENWSFKPQLSYTFTSTLRGGAFFELGERKDLRAGNTKITAFGINVNISLAGR